MKIIEGFLSKHKERVVGLDILRTFAIMLVVYEHGLNLLPERFHDTLTKDNVLNIDGVSVFFVLSGFLIGGILLRIIDTTSFTSRDMFNFWVRRWFRTIPNYLFVLLAIVLYRLIFIGDLGLFNVKYLFFAQNFLSPHPDFFPEAWSLAVEEWFYLLFPLVFFVLYKIIRTKKTAILIAIGIFLTVPLLIRIIKYEMGIGVDLFDLHFRKIALLRLDSLMYGIIGAYLVSRYPGFWKKSRVGFTIAGFLLILLLDTKWVSGQNFYGPVSFNIESIATFCFLPALSLLKTTRFRWMNAFFIFISIISYSMYLLNLTPVQRYLIPITNNILGTTDLSMESVYGMNYLLFWIYTILGSYLLYRFFEHPFTNLRDKIRVK